MFLHSLSNLPVVGSLQLKTFCDTVQGIRTAYDLVKSLGDCLDGHGLPTSKILLAAANLSERSSAHEILRNIESHIEGRPSAPKLRLPHEVNSAGVLQCVFW